MAWFRNTTKEMKAAPLEQPAENPLLHLEKAEDDILKAVEELTEALQIQAKLEPTEDVKNVHDDMVAPAIQLLTRHLDQYVEMSVTAGAFINRWPSLLRNIGDLSADAATASVQYVFEGSQIAHAAFEKDPSLLTQVEAYRLAAAKFRIESSMATALSHLALSDADLAFVKVTYVYEEEEQEKAILASLQQYAVLTLKDGTFRQAWGTILDQVAAIDPELAAQASREIYYNPEAKFSGIEDISSACEQTQKLALVAGLRGYFAIAAAAAAKAVDMSNVNNLPKSLQESTQKSLDTILSAWHTSVFDRIDDTRTPEERETAQRAFAEFESRWQAASESVVAVARAAEAPSQGSSAPKPSAP